MCENSFYYVDPFDVSHLSPYNDPDYMEQYAELELSSAWCCDWYPNAKLDLELPF